MAIRLPSKVEVAQHTPVGMLINLRPAQQGRHPVEIKLGSALVGIGHVGHQIDITPAKRGQALLPLTGDVNQLPVVPAGNFLQQVNKDAAWALLRIDENFGLVFINADPQLARLCLSQAGQQEQQRENIFHRDGGLAFVVTINIQPLTVFPDETADFVQTLAAAGDPVAGNELDGGIGLIRLFDGA
jgi:hypothetical protein